MCIDPQHPLFLLRGRIIHGQANGRTVQMPTANLLPDPDQCLPPFGVYASLAEADGKTWIGVTNVGLRPTLDSNQTPTVETYLLHYDGNLYGQRMTLRLYAFLRPTRKMDSLEKVHEQVKKDAEQAMLLLRDLSAES